jgi:hypothetical protein
MDGRTALLEGMARTQAYLLNAGLIELKGEREKPITRIPKIFRRPMA